jgi:UDP-N-acetylmuramate dehydrogenase
VPIKENYDLSNLNTFGVSAEAKYFGVFHSLAELEVILSSPKISAEPILCLGSGSNVLFVNSFAGAVLCNRIKGIEIVSETEHSLLVKVGAGTVWHDFVEYCLQHSWAGPENLALIPGTVGAAPIQNIGAYGVEVKELIESVEVYDCQSRHSLHFTNLTCEFGYRDSVFKHQGKGQWIIITVTFKLSKIAVPKIHYGAVQGELIAAGITAPTLRDVAEAVIRIRKSKLPDPQILGNAGSFFKNPFVGAEQFADLKVKFPGIVGYPEDNGTVKVAAGWLIERVGFKGHRSGNCGVHQDQALVLVNYGGATGQELLALAAKVVKQVQITFNITLETEVNIIR